MILTHLNVLREKTFADVAVIEDQSAHKPTNWQQMGLKERRRILPAGPPYCINTMLMNEVTKLWVEYQMKRFANGMPLADDNERIEFITEQAKISHKFFFDAPEAVSDNTWPHSYMKFVHACAATQTGFYERIAKIGKEFSAELPLMQQLERPSIATIKIPGSTAKPAQPGDENILSEGFQIALAQATNDQADQQEVLSAMGFIIYGYDGADFNFPLPSETKRGILKRAYAGDDDVRPDNLTIPILSL